MYMDVDLFSRQTDYMRSVSENIIFGQLVPAGNLSETQGSQVLLGKVSYVDT